jgi:membrane protein implicated in regulation of membrane protease activity
MLRKEHRHIPHPGARAITFCHDGDMAAVLWLIIGILLVLAEVLSGAFVLVMLGSAALVTAVAAAVGAGPIVSSVVFAAVAAGGITLARPALVRRMHTDNHVKTNVDALLGAKAHVVATVDAHSGQVKVNGEIWSARAYDETEVLQPGRSVTIMSISGATAVVWGGL